MGELDERAKFFAMLERFVELGQRLYSLHDAAVHIRDPVPLLDDMDLLQSEIEKISRSNERV